MTDDPLNLGRIECGRCRTWHPPARIITAFYVGDPDYRCLACWPTLMHAMNMARCDRARRQRNGSP